MRKIYTSFVLQWCLPPTVFADLPAYVGSHDRFWRQNEIEKSIIIDGVDRYHSIKSCIDEHLNEGDRNLMSLVPNNRTIGRTIVDRTEGLGPIANQSQVIFLEVLNAITPIHAKAVQTLAACVRNHAPSLYENRPMYLEFGLDEDVQSSLGGNNPTHIAALLNIFLPEVKKDMMRTIQLAYDEANWEKLTSEDELVHSKFGGARVNIHPEPKDLGFRASEHLTYSGHKSLGDHVDGAATAYTLNFAFSAPEDYEGGFLYLYDESQKKHFLKPPKYTACVFLGGLYMHGVTEILSGHREMFSSEMWFNPDIPLNSNLWTSTPESMEEYILRCNDIVGQGKPCQAEFPDVTANGISVKDNRAGIYNGEDDDDFYDDDDDDGSGLVPFWNEKEMYPANIEYLSIDEEPNFLIPKHLNVAEIFPLYFRGTNQRVKDDEAYSIALPPELLVEFQRYIEQNGMLRHARQMIYEGGGIGHEEHRLYKLDDNMIWGCMGPRWEGMDMVWIDPGNEACFEQTVSVLRRGNFDLVLKAVGEHFNLEGLMVTGIGPIFLSHFDHDPEYRQIHSDLPGAKGSFFNVVVPLYIPEGGATLYVGDDEDILPLQMRYNIGTLLGSETIHGTGECDYRENRDVRLSVAIYLADLNDDNAEIIASDSTSLWPTEGDVDWFVSQRGRFWRNDGSRSLSDDKGREPFKVEDHRSDCESLTDLCMTDPTGVRLECPKSCELYMPNEEYNFLFLRHP